MSGNIRKAWSGWGSSGTCMVEPAPQLFPASSTSCWTYSCSTYRGHAWGQRWRWGNSGTFCCLLLPHSDHWPRAITAEAPPATMKEPGSRVPAKTAHYTTHISQDQPGWAAQCSEVHHQPYGQRAPPSLNL